MINESDQKLNETSDKSISKTTFKLQGKVLYNPLILIKRCLIPKYPKSEEFNNKEDITNKNQNETRPNPH